jgi:hypothetical protein
MNSFLCKRVAKDVHESTHLSLVGGKYTIPYCDMDAFYELYVTELDHKHPLFLVERVRYPCRLFVDLDNVTPEQRSAIMDTWQHVDDCQISVRNSDQGKENVGIHMIFTKIIVQSCEDAILEAEKKFERDQLDTSVYKSGLRMLGSNKNRKMTRIYHPASRTQSYRITVNDMYNHSLLVKNVSTKLPVSPDKCARAKTSVTSSCGSSSSMEEINFERIHPKYKNVRIARIHKQDSEITFYTYERFCTNIGREHKSNHIYIVFHEPTKTMTQRCFCTCAHTGCRGFVSAPKPIPIKLFYTI